MRSAGTPGLDEVGDAIDERAGLAGAGAGDDEERAFTICRGRPLLRIELGGEASRRGGDVGAAGVEARVGHGGKMIDARGSARPAARGAACRRRAERAGRDGGGAESGASREAPLGVTVRGGGCDAGRWESVFRGLMVGTFGLGRNLRSSGVLGRRAVDSRRVLLGGGGPALCGGVSVGGRKRDEGRALVVRPAPGSGAAVGAGSTKARSDNRRTGFR